MNILMTLSQLEVTGAEVYSVSVANKLLELGHNVFIASDTLTTAYKTKAVYVTAPLSKRTIPYRIKNTIWLIKFIKKNDIHIVNAHSRASAWVSRLACLIARVPLVVFIHGRQATFLSRKLFHCYGDYTIAVCEKLEEQLFEVFKLPRPKIEVLRNGFKIGSQILSDPPKQKTISLIGRLSGPKGDLAYRLLDFFYNKMNGSDELNGVKIRVVGGQTIPERFQKFQDKIEFTGFVQGLEGLINDSTLVIGSGRIAIEALLHKRNLVAVGEACSIGLITQENIQFALETNFGDMDATEKVFNFEKIYNDVLHASTFTEFDSALYEKIKFECDENRIVRRLEYIFQSVMVRYYKKEIPIIYYHRVIKDLSHAGKHGIYITAEMFDEHLHYLKAKGFQTVSFAEALQIKRENRKGKFVIITFDDGYEDNYLYAYPILKEYSYSAIIFLVAGLQTNSWDKEEPQVRMLGTSQIKEMHKNGIEFGSHTLSHCDLTKVSLHEAEGELRESKKMLEDKLGFEIKSIAYPYGNCNDEIKKLSEAAGYELSFATDKAPIGLHEDRHQIRRIAIFPNTDVRGLARKVKGNYVFRKEKNDSLYLQIPR
ncbi:MAG: polysaccharide deacetylase family protein [Bacteroidetes bacterium]|nr:polysaccharide deacetylase family protein [Bacteroidota bacterium]